MNRVSIKSDGTPETTKIWVDGKPLDNVIDIEVRFRIGSFVTARVVMDVFVDQVDVDAPSLIRQSREVARMTDQEALERAFQLLETADAKAVMQRLADVVAKRANR